MKLPLKSRYRRSPQIKAACFNLLIRAVSHDKDKLLPCIFTSAIDIIVMELRSRPCYEHVATGRLISRESFTILLLFTV